MEPFDKWAVDFVGPINPPRKRMGVRYIISVTNYLTRWAEATPVVDCTTVTAAKFIFENIVMRFGYHRVLMSNQGSHLLRPRNSQETTTRDSPQSTFPISP